MLDNHLKLSVCNIGEQRRRIFFGRAHYGPKGVCGPRIQSDFQLVVMLKGSARVDINNATVVQIPEFHVALMRPGNREHFFFDPNSAVHHTWCAAQPQLIPPDRQVELLKAPPVLPLSSRMRELIDLGLSLPPLSTAVGESFMEQLGLAAFENYLYEASVRRLANDQSDSIRRALLYIDQHLGEQISLAQLCEAAYISKQHLIRSFTKELGSTPSRYIWNLRTQKGGDLLRETGIPVSEIAAQLGFQSPFHFSRLIKDACGVSPRALRAKAWQFNG